jgi:ribosomal protein S18 acetylase RimI-like enzyme
LVSYIGDHKVMEEGIQTHILKTIQTSRSGLQMEELAEKLSLSRHTVAKYLEVLKAEGKIHYNKIGRTKLWKDVSAFITTRFLGMDDLDAILRIAETVENQGYENSEKLAFVREAAVYHLEHGDPLMNIGAEIDLKLVGFIFGEIRLWEFGRGERTGWIKLLGVDPEYQGMGVGHKLGATLLDHFLKKNVKKVRTLVGWSDAEIISYFNSLGFTMLGMLPLEKEL